jgi:hypothetical protein
VLAHGFFYIKFGGKIILNFMILTTHALAGTIVASVIPNHPILGFGLALSSHYLMDTVPHWEYRLRTESFESPTPEKISWFSRNFILDILTIKLDFIFGIALSIIFLLFAGSFSWTVLTVGVIAGVLPDVLQFAYILYSKPPFTWTQKIHDFFHTNINWKNRPLVGSITQIVILIILVLATFFDSCC